MEEKQEGYDEIKNNTFLLKAVDCSASTSCSFWRRGNFCSFPGKLEIGGMGTCLSQEPKKELFTVNRLAIKGTRYLP